MKPVRISSGPLSPGPAALLVGFASLLFSSLLLAQADRALLKFVDELDSALPPPTYAIAAQRIAINSAVLAESKVGSDLLLQVSASEIATLQLVETGSFINGDRTLRAQGSDAAQFYSLTLTVGQHALFGHLSSADGTWQIYAVGSDGVYAGWLYQPGSLGDGSNTFQNDYVIPDYDRRGTAVSRPVAEIRSTLPLELGLQQGSASEQVQVKVADIDASNFSVSQNFSRDPVIVGNSVEAQITFENISEVWHRGLFVENFFLLENSRLLSAPDQCREQLSWSLQKVLYCELGDFAPGESKVLSYTVATSEESKPQVMSTLLVGNLRLDSKFNVVDDVLIDSDADGISDFNEALLNTDPADPASVDRTNSVIDVMAFYTPGASALYPGGVETRINQLIGVANQVYADSGVAITLRPVYHGEVAYNDTDDMDTALNHIIEKTDPAFSDVDALRLMYGGDLVMLFRPLGFDTMRCGLSPVGGFNTGGDFSAATEKDFAYSNIAIDCPTDIVVAHELGHNMGLTHSHLEDGSGGTFNFSTGYGVDSQFVTVMAMPVAFNTETRIAQFSNPALDCLGFICGVDASEEFGADAVQSLNIVRHQIADFLPSVVPALPAAIVVAASGEETNASIAIAATRDHGLSYSNTVEVGDIINIVADLGIDDRHVGMEGTVHILIGLRDGALYQFNARGEVVGWDGTIAGLVPAIDMAPLRTREYLNILSDFRISSSLQGEEVRIFVAYLLSATGDIIYTPNPMVLSIQ